MRGWRFGRREVLALALLAGASGGPLLAQSAGEQLVRRDALDQIFEAREELVLHEEPERVPVLGFLWWDGEPTGETIRQGKQVRVSDVKESSLGWRRFVWVKVETKDDVDGATSEAASQRQEEADNPAEQSGGGEGTREHSDTPTVTGWLKLGGQHKAIGSLRKQLERVGETPGR